jgi:hypothetical protein
MTARAQIQKQNYYDVQVQLFYQYQKDKNEIVCMVWIYINNVEVVRANCQFLIEYIQQDQTIILAKKNITQTCQTGGIYSRQDGFLSSSCLEYLRTAESSSMYSEEPLKTIERPLSSNIMNAKALYVECMQTCQFQNSP